MAWLPTGSQTHGLPVRAQPLLGVQHVVNAPAIALQQVLAALLACPRALAGGEGKVLPAALLALQDPAQADRKARVMSTLGLAMGVAVAWTQHRLEPVAESGRSCPAPLQNGVLLRA
ncbi:hypothetical protein MC885_005810, partial [Smutsia gigantea]